MTTTGLEKYIPNDADDAVKRTTDFFCAKDELWSLPRFWALSDRFSTHGGFWAERCALQMLPLCHSPHIESLSKDLETLKDLRDRKVSRDKICLRGEEIWYRQPARDWIQTAIEGLYWGVAHDLYRNEAGHDGHDAIDFAGAVDLLAKAEDYPELFLSIAIEQFQFVLERRLHGVKPSEMLGLVGADDYGFRRSNPNV